MQLYHNVAAMGFRHVDAVFLVSIIVVFIAVTCDMNLIWRPDEAVFCHSSIRVLCLILFIIIFFSAHVFVAVSMQLNLAVLMIFFMIKAFPNDSYDFCPTGRFFQWGGIKIMKEIKKSFGGIKNFRMMKV